MRNRRFIRTAVLLISAFLICSAHAAYADGIGPDALMTGRTDFPITVKVSEPVFRLIARFGADRTESFNKILKHIGFSVTVDGDLSETVISVDGEPAFSYLETSGDGEKRTVYSFDPDTAYICGNDGAEKEENGITGFLEDHFFTLNRLLDGFYPFFEKTAETFSEFSKSTKTSLNFSGYGRGVRQISIVLPAQYVSEHLPEACAAIADAEDIRQFVGRLIFKGTQKIMLLYDQEDRLLRIRYDGEAGFSEDSMRSVSAAWRCVRNGNEKKDHLTLKTPAKKGGDRYNLTYERAVSLQDDSTQKISWDLQIDLKDGELREKDSFTGELSAGDQLNGNIVYSRKTDGTEQTVTIVPAMKKENGDEYAGALEIKENSGKIITSSFTAQLSVGPGVSLTAPEYVKEYIPETQDPDDENKADPVQDRIAGILITKLLALPQEDLGYFSMDIPADTWNSLLQSY